MTSFQDLKISHDRIQQLAQQQITEPTSVQKKAIPEVLAGKDVMIQSKPGTGKTLAYVLPLLEQIDVTSKELQAMILTPTHELAMQIQSELHKLLPDDKQKIQTCIGGVSIKRQIEKLKDKPSVVIGTAGRILELNDLKKLKMHNVKHIIVDEVDRYIELKDAAGVEKVLKSGLRDTQKIFASATLPEFAKVWEKEWMRDPVHIVGDDEGESSVQHVYVLTEERSKVDILRRIVHATPSLYAIIFINENKKMEPTLEKLRFVGLDAEPLSGELQSQARAVTLKSFREKKYPLLLSTDLAARGLDIEGLTHVIHYDVPLQPDHYIHRSGRTGRMGKAGTVVTIVTPREQAVYLKMMRKLAVPAEERVLYQGRLLKPQQADTRQQVNISQNNRTKKSKPKK